MSNTTINLAEVAIALENIKQKANAETNDITDKELYVFDMNGNKVIL